MKIIKFILILLILFFYTRCSKGTSSSDQPVVNSKYLHNLVIKAVSGDIDSNTKLSNLVDNSYPINKNFNKLSIDSINYKGKTFYYVLLEYSNPAYNRFAVYDKNFNLYLVDKSLNGELNFGKLEIDGMLFGRIVENFLSRDVILKRLSLYRINKDSIALAFRSYTSFNSPSLLISQEIKSFLKDTIITDILLTEKLKDIPARDTFFYVPSSNSFLSKNNTFDKLVIDHLKNDKSKSGLPEITDESSLRSSLGIQNKTK